jgi:hypothetical protein
MAGSWSTGSLPKRPGAYFNFKAQPAVLVPPAVGSIVCVPFTHSWGPLEVLTPLASFSEFSARFGNDLTSQGYKAVRQAFRGEDVNGRRGAGQVLAYRMGASAAAKATVTLQNTAPAAAMPVTALYQGSRGNNLRITIQTDPQDATKRDFIVIDGLSEVERYVYVPTVLADLAAQINGLSDYVSVAVTVDGVALTAVVAAPLTGGNDGSTLVAQDYTDMMTAVESGRFGYLAPADLTDPTILASMKTWAVNLNSKGKRFFLVVGGAAAESATQAITRASTLNDPDIVTVGIGSIRDDEMLDANSAPITLSTAQFAPRLAGVLSALGGARSLTGARISGVTLIGGATETVIDNAMDAGVTVLSADSDLEAPVHVEVGRTTYTVKSNANTPYMIFRNPKFVRTMHDLQGQITEFVQSEVIGQMPVNSQTRSSLIGEVSRYLQAFQDNNEIQGGWSVQVAAEPPPSDDDEFVALDVYLAFARSTEQVLLNITVR